VWRRVFLGRKAELGSTFHKAKVAASKLQAFAPSLLTISSSFFIIITLEPRVEFYMSL